MGYISEDYCSEELSGMLMERGYIGAIKIYLGEDDINVKQITIQSAMKWLREEHGLVAVVDYEYEYTDTSYYYKIYRLGENGKPERIAVKGASYNELGQLTEHIVMYRDYKRGGKEYHTYEEACEAAIRYCIENLV